TSCPGEPGALARQPARHLRRAAPARPRPARANQAPLGSGTTTGEKSWSWNASLRRPIRPWDEAFMPTEPSRNWTFSVIEAESDVCPGAVARNVPVATFSPWLGAVAL